MGGKLSPVHRSNNDGRRRTANEPVDIALVQLPLASPWQPPMWLGCLHDYLMQAGITSKPMDLSISTFQNSPAPLQWPWLKDRPDGAWENPLDDGIVEVFSQTITEHVQLLSELPASVLGFHLSHLSGS